MVTTYIYNNRYTCTKLYYLKLLSASLETNSNELSYISLFAICSHYLAQYSNVTVSSEHVL